MIPRDSEVHLILKPICLGSVNYFDELPTGRDTSSCLVSRSLDRQRTSIESVPDRSLRRNLNQFVSESTKFVCNCQSRNAIPQSETFIFVVQSRLP